MATVNYSFEPNDNVFGVVEDTKVLSGTIKEVTIVIDDSGTTIRYTIESDSKIKLINSSNVFATFQEACDKIDDYFNNV